MACLMPSHASTKVINAESEWIHVVGIHRISWISWLRQALEDDHPLPNVVPQEGQRVGLEDFIERNLRYYEKSADILRDPSYYV